MSRTVIPPAYKGDDHLVQAAADPAGALRDQPRLERRDPVPGHGQAHTADLGEHRLRGGPVAGVRRAVPGRIDPLPTTTLS